MKPLDFTHHEHPIWPATHPHWGMRLPLPCAGCGLSGYHVAGIEVTDRFCQHCHREHDALESRGWTPETVRRHWMADAPKRYDRAVAARQKGA